MPARHPAHLECPLNLDNYEIRLLRLHPESSADRIKFDFLRVDVTQKHSYYALSYVWGSNESPCSVYVHGWRFQVTRNLHSALQMLRVHNKGKHLLLWVDAICIDQLWTPERNHQVGIMGRIYSQCQEAFAWMGEMVDEYMRSSTIVKTKEKSYHFTGDKTDFDHNWETYLSAFTFKDGEERNIEAISEFATDPTVLETDLHCAWLIRSLAAGYHLTDIAPFCSTVFEGTEYFAKFQKSMLWLQGNAWFTRLWVVQEAVLAPSVRVFFGTVSLPLGVLVKAMENYWNHIARRCYFSTGQGHYNLRCTTRGFLQNFNPIVNLRGQTDEVRSAPFLLELCLEFLERSASMDMDRIYALLGLLKNDEGLRDSRRIIPDYDRPILEVYSKVSSVYIECTSSLLPLSFAGSKNRCPGLPSWAIDWTMCEQGDAEHYEVWRELLPLFQLSNNLPTAHIKLEGRALTVHGIEIDVITTLGRTMNQSTGFAFNTSLESWKNMILSEHDPESPYAMGSTWNEACRDIEFIKTHLSTELRQILLDGPDTYDESPSSETFRLDNGKHVPSEEHLKDILGMVSSFLQGRRLFLTKGYLGLGNKGILSGDTVFIFPGAPTPLILRKEATERSLFDQGAAHRLISECYLHGFMDELCDGIARSESKGWGPITIV